MSEQDSTQSSTQQRRSRKTSTATQQKSKRVPVAPRPANGDTEEWKEYWKTQGLPWRTEPEIDAERQKYLSEHRSIRPDWKQGIFPFKGIKLSRADVEWLLATHENGRGPVVWSDETQRERIGLDVRGADLRQADLHSLPLAGLCAGLLYWEWAKATLEQRIGAVAHLEEANLREAQLAGSYLRGTRLTGTYLRWAQLEEADLNSTELKGSYLRFAKLKGADLRNAQLAGANIREAELDGAYLTYASMGDEKHIGPLVADTLWGNVNLAVVKWSQVNILGDEQKARQKKTKKGEEKDKVMWLEEYENAVRANRQLAIALQSQGLNEDAARFAYRAQRLQRVVLRRQRKFGTYLFSLFLDLLAGYGYRLGRSLIAYALVISIFATIYLLLSNHLAWNEAIVISMTAFHGRGFFPEQFHPGDPQALIAAIEAFIGLLIEVTLIATLTQRLFGK